MCPCFTIGYHIWMNCYLCEDIEQSKVFIAGHSCMQVHVVFSMKLLWGAFDLSSGTQLCCTPQIHLDSSWHQIWESNPPVGPGSTEEMLVRRSGAMCFLCCLIVVLFCVPFFSLDFSSDTDSLKTGSTWYNLFGGAAWTPFPRMSILSLTSVKILERSYFVYRL